MVWMGSMVINNFNVVRAVRFPAEINSPLVVDADGVLAFAAALEGFQPVAWRNAKLC